MGGRAAPAVGVSVSKGGAALTSCVGMPCRIAAALRDATVRLRRSNRLDHTAACSWKSGI